MGAVSTDRSVPSLRYRSVSSTPGPPASQFKRAVLEKRHSLPSRRPGSRPARASLITVSALTRKKSAASRLFMISDSAGTHSPSESFCKLLTAYESLRKLVKQCGAIYSWCPAHSGLFGRSGQYESKIGKWLVCPGQRAGGRGRGVSRPQRGVDRSGGGTGPARPIASGRPPTA